MFRVSFLWERLTRCVTKAILPTMSPFWRVYRRLPLGLKIGLWTSLSVFVLAVTILVALVSLPITAGLSTSAVLLILAALVVLGSSVALLVTSHHYVDRPLTELSRLIQSAEKKDFLLRSPVRSDDSIGRLAGSFNRLMERITMLDAFKLERERELAEAQREIRYKKTIEEKNRHLRLIYQITQALSASFDSENIYQEVLDIVGRRLGYHELALLLFNEGQETLKVVATYGADMPDNIIGLTFKVGEGVSSETIRAKKPIYIPDTSKDNRYLYYKGCKPEEVTFLSVPLITEKDRRVVGVLNLSRSLTDPFRPQEIETVKAVSRQIAMAIENAHLYAQMRELSVTDELTGLYNRRHGGESLEREIQRASRFEQEFSVLMIDIDHFKHYNDCYGHAAGDLILKEFAHLIRKALRDVDYVARWGGEEFVVILPNTAHKGGLKVAEKIRRLVRNHPFLKRANEPKLTFTVSIGLAHFPANAMTATALVEAADKAMYAAKHDGRNRVVASQGDTSIRQAS